ncbi:hypothetical protein JZX86_16645 [Agrobacterium rosae]|nr:hypothetical protein [Agrobacterium rosae]MCM2436195.1 hypothetical protein [Agrobacterium rosae]
MRLGATTSEISVPSDLMTDSGDTLRVWCVAGLGISLREKRDVAGDLRAGRLIQILKNWEKKVSYISFVRPKRHPVPKRIKVFGDFLAQQRRNPPWES